MRVDQYRMHLQERRYYQSNLTKQHAVTQCIVIYVVVMKNVTHLLTYVRWPHLLRLRGETLLMYFICSLKDARQLSFSSHIFQQHFEMYFHSLKRTSTNIFLS